MGRHTEFCFERIKLMLPFTLVSTTTTFINFREWESDECHNKFRFKFLNLKNTTKKKKCSAQEKRFLI